MNDIYVTLTGNVAAEPRQYTFEDGVKVTSLRVLHTPRHFDRKTGQWSDGETVAFAVRCWRELADNVAQSVRVGHPVVVSGKLRIKEFEGQEGRRFMPEVEATTVGHNLRWGVGGFSRPDRAATSRERRDVLDEDTRDWAMGDSRPPTPRPLDHHPAQARPAQEPRRATPARAFGDPAHPWPTETPRHPADGGTAPLHPAATWEAPHAATPTESGTDPLHPAATWGAPHPARTVDSGSGIAASSPHLAPIPATSHPAAAAGWDAAHPATEVSGSSAPHLARTSAASHPATAPADGSSALHPATGASGSSAPHLARTSAASHPATAPADGSEVDLSAAHLAATSATSPPAAAVAD
ncbi:MAG: single-stranded DNA-binding protein, partial [Nonomuraea sp.]|nr:single-stranded DNA-binding protein [Nonomuraea sp.]